MAFKCVRDFAEHLKILGYQEIVPLSLINTIHGNTEVFRVYANILIWLIKCLDPDYVLPHETHTEANRVQLIKSATEFLAVSAGIKLNPRKLYAATSATAKELLKVTTALIDSSKDVNLSQTNQPVNFEEVINDNQIEVIRKIRNLSSELTVQGVNIYDLISKESVNESMRNQYSNLPLELNYVEKSLKQSIAIMKKQLTQNQSLIANQNDEKHNLNLKIQRKSTELERTKQRFEALQKIKPAYLGEFEKYEQNVKELFGQYIIRVKCLDALRNFVTHTATPKSMSPVTKVQDSSIPILPEGLSDSNDDDDGDGNSDDVNSKEEPSSMNQDIFKQITSRLKSRSDRKLGSKPERSVKISDEFTVSETSPESEELESELDFIMDLEDEDERMVKFKRDSSNNNRNNKAEASDEDF